jgi:hypothetical protein
VLLFHSSGLYRLLKKNFAKIDHLGDQTTLPLLSFTNFCSEKLGTAKELKTEIQGANYSKRLVASAMIFDAIAFITSLAIGILAATAIIFFLAA